METIISYAIPVSIFVVLACLKAIIDSNAHKLHFILRYTLILPYSLIEFILVGVGIRFIIMIFSLFWNESDTIINIYIISYTLLPFITSYVFVNFSKDIAPKHLTPIAFALSILVISIHIYIYYMSFLNETIIFGDGLLDLYGLKRGNFGEIIYLISVILGVVFAIKHSKSETSFFD